MFNVVVLTILIPIFLLIYIQELIRWFMLASVCVRVPKSDVDYGVTLDFL